MKMQMLFVYDFHLIHCSRRTMNIYEHINCAKQIMNAFNICTLTAESYPFSLC